ncbi:DUF5017 domain-containing protein [Pedobacter sp. BS3]|uniref:DUF5017 domain-containing protein n=1 Tax=Pedobacter sp. BS3 TaxID=2567937 RepID=UPI0011EE255F|nr:DUF5017 domain-containing protein [Pedobacter sp. BS3]TZF83004.1 DUF5017 domain-containing protein [Pedobacter sp. BS3]
MKDLIKIYLIAGLCVSAMVASCNKDPEGVMDRPKIDVEDPTSQGPMSFDVRVDESSTLKVGDTVKFIMEGNPDMVSFYSGAIGNDYAYKDTERFYDIVANLSFRSGKAPNNNTEANWDCAQLVYSTDFNGDRSSGNAYTNVQAATWTNITNRFALPTVPGDIANYVNSGAGDISDIFAAGKPVYLAWHCTTQAASNRVQFRVIESSIQGIVIGNSSLSRELYTQSQLGFQWVENPASAAQASNRPTVSSTQVMWNGIFNNLTGPFKEGYAISGPLTLPQFNAGKDMPTVIITKQNKNALVHKFVYSKAGNYEVVFIAANTHVNEQPEIIKKLNITITP